MPLQEATDVRKKKDQLRDKIFERQSTGNKTKGSRTIQPKKHRNFNPKTVVKCEVQCCVDKIIVIIEARKQDVFDAVGNQATKSLESLLQKKDDVEKLKLCWNEV